MIQAPFSVHPKTGKICVPFLAEDVDDFDLDKVPTILSIRANPDELKSSVKILQSIADDCKAQTAAISMEAQPHKIIIIITILIMKKQTAYFTYIPFITANAILTLRPIVQIKCLLQIIDRGRCPTQNLIMKNSPSPTIWSLPSTKWQVTSPIGTYPLTIHN